MKSMILTLMLSLIFCSVVEAQKKSHRELEGLKGPVRKITEETVNLSEEHGKWIEAEKGSVTIIVFDRAGNLLEHTSYAPNPNSGKLEQLERSVYSYDAEGRRTKKEFSDVPVVMLPGDRPIPKNEMPPPSVRTRDGATLQTEVDKFDASGNLVETITHNGTAEGATFKRETYNYNAQTRTREKLTYDFRNQLIKKTIIKFDEQGNMVESLDYDLVDKGMFDTKTRCSDYQFDAKGNWIKMTALSSGIGKNDPSEVEKFVIKRKITYY
ncbi:MAG TPA: hypothetical protein VG324_30220 [Blastocatellia bacterium]|nr:hypothetical protein [Blastocatellia bacterium]